jgi:SAM-dependent methyltransferase
VFAWYTAAAEVTKVIEIRHDKMEGLAQVQQAYNDIYSGKGIQHLDSFYLWLIELLQPEEGRLLVDISCGQGRLPILAAQRGLKALGVDFSIDGLKRGYQVDPAIGWAVGDGEKLPLPDACSDYVTHIGSLEHYLTPALGAAEIARILKPGGRACVFVPNTFGLLGNIKYAWRHGDAFDDGQPLQRYATHRQWVKLLEGGGLKVQRTIGYGEIVT